MNRLFFLLLFAPVLLFSQYLLNTNHNILVNSSQIGDELLLFVPDSAVQILRNPARAADYSDKFVYITHSGFKYHQINYYLDFYDYPVEIFKYDTRLPKLYTQSVIISNEIPTISGAYLFGKDKNKWLFRFSSGIDNSDLKRSDIRVNDEKDAADQSSFSYQYKSKYKASLNECSLYKISKKSNINIAYGIFAGLDFYSRNLSGKRYDDRNYILDINFRNRMEKREYISERNNNKYFVGFGFSASDKKWDFITKAAYQKTDFKIDKSENYFRSATDSLYSNPHEIIYYSRKIRQYKSTQKGKPDIFHLDLYFRNRSDWLFNNDNYFFKLNGFYTTETQKITYSDLNYYLSYNADTLYSTWGDTSNAIGKSDLENFNIGFTAGYVVPYKLDDINIVSGVIFSTDYSHNERVILNNTNRNRNYYAVENANDDISFSILRLKFPLYLNYIPNDWFELYGGLNFHLEYKKFKEERKQNWVDDLDEELYNQDITRLHSFRSTYLGVNLKHKSGLRLQIAFNNDFSHFQYWNFSLGYIF